MTEEQRAELRSIREEQRTLRRALEGLETRVNRLLEPAPVAVPKLPPPVKAAPAVDAATAYLSQRAAPPPPPIASPAPAAENLEVHLGAKWMVRLAVFMLIAALAFLANYLYQNVVPHLGPAAKVGLLYLGAGALTGLGLWLERSRHSTENPGALNYARIVLAGGLAAVYYVTYAAHHYERLRVIQSPLLAGLLLLGWTAFMTWLADRRGSQTLAAFSILLAYFASATSDVAGFTLAANLGLTVAAVFLVLRQRWTAFSFACLAATFGSYAFWRYGNSFGPGTGGVAGWRIEGAFLACYWVLFTVGALVDRQQTFGAPGRRATFVSLNNGAFFALVSVLVRDQAPDVFWRWPLALGVVLLVLGELGRRWKRPLDAASVDSYFFGGISLVTLGLILYFSGWRLSVILAVESATVLAAACRRGSKALFVAAGGVALISVAVALLQLLVPGAREHWIEGTICGAILLFNAWQCRWFARERGALGEGYFALLGLGVWFALLEVQITDEFWRSPLLALAALGLTAALYPLSLRTAAALAQLFLTGAYIHWLETYGAVGRAAAPPLWNPGVVLAVTVLLGIAVDRFKKNGSLLYEGAAFVLFVLAADKYFDPGARFNVVAAGGAAVMALGWSIPQPRLRWWSLALNVAAVLVFAAAPSEHGYRCLAGIVPLAGAQPFVRRVGRERGLGGPKLEGALISVAALCLWMWISRQLQQIESASFALAAGWSIYGGLLFGVGIAARERVCRWWGLGVLAAALAHLIFVDIWTLGNLERFISLLVVGLVLLAVSFFYNRLSSSIREWL